MKYRLVLTEQADSDLRGIYEYIAFSLLEPGYAAGQLDRLEEKILKLAEMPKKFRLYEKEPWHSRGLHQMPVDNFIVFYIPKEEDGIVTVIRIMFNGRDIDKQLRKTTV
ncbi:type II toxin-antitoxin system RelE/ParE family toxin [Robinsoniella peoriensis]|uniref:type II toxin-antitoxin system RelE/ParE family toxin n=1 Tax=Robinsoniella peoriensis TaxID=180332 RepID=UPI00374FE0D9